MLINERITFEQILCPVDLSSDSREELQYGMALAKSYRAKLWVCHCLSGGAANAKSITESLEESVAALIQDQRASGLDWEVIVLEGDPASTITRVAAELGIHLIVMRSRRRPFAAALLGSTAESISRTAPCPVMVSHAEGREWVNVSTGEVRLDRVMVAYDFSSDSELALSYGLSLAQEYQAEIHLLHVLRPITRAESPEVAFLPLSFESAFQEAARRLRLAVLPWCDIQQAVREGLPYREVLTYADEQNIDLICMGASGMGFGMRALFGSNADRVMRQSPCPVLIARPLKPAIITAADARLIGNREAARS
jgi:nucleotide-binding universal stress UspA family protein